jgi:hypothetical protein
MTDFLAWYLGHLPAILLGAALIDVVWLSAAWCIWRKWRK